MLDLGKRSKYKALEDSKQEKPPAVVRKPEVLEPIDKSTDWGQRASKYLNETFPRLNAEERKATIETWQQEDLQTGEKNVPPKPTLTRAKTAEALRQREIDARKRQAAGIFKRQGKEFSDADLEAHVFKKFPKLNLTRARRRAEKLEDAKTDFSVEAPLTSTVSKEVSPKLQSNYEIVDNLGKVVSGPHTYGELTSQLTSNVTAKFLDPEFKDHMSRMYPEGNPASIASTMVEEGLNTGKVRLSKDSYPVTPDVDIKVQPHEVSELLSAEGTERVRQAITDLDDTRQANAASLSAKAAESRVLGESAQIRTLRNPESGEMEEVIALERPKFVYDLDNPPTKTYDLFPLGAAESAISSVSEDPAMKRMAQMRRNAEALAAQNKKVASEKMPSVKGRLRGKIGAAGLMLGAIGMSSIGEASSLNTPMVKK